MGRFCFLTLLLFLSLVLVPAGRAQAPAEALEWLTVDLWPDYDRPQLLVLLTGALPAEASRPATVAVPLPPEATVNAVARISAENRMIDDIEYSVEGDRLFLVTPDARFRVEYYVPYTGDGRQRQFTFRWESELDVQEMDVSVQQPRAATALTVQPAPASVIEGTDELQYHNLPLREAPAGEPYVVEVQYTMGSEALTQAEAPGANAGAAAAAQTEAGLTWGWPVVLAAAGAALILLALGWQLFAARAGAGYSAPRKPDPRRGRSPAQPAGAPQVRYCHNCGQRSQPGDRFCRECGTRLKG